MLKVRQVVCLDELRFSDEEHQLTAVIRPLNGDGRAYFLNSFAFRVL
jgi:hypothetical protein